MFVERGNRTKIVSFAKINVLSSCYLCYKCLFYQNIFLLLSFFFNVTFYQNKYQLFPTQIQTQTNMNRIIIKFNPFEFLWFYDVSRYLDYLSHVVKTNNLEKRQRQVFSGEHFHVNVES